jgi:HD-GYP domain-containing protein (c-di-GMP phosphodiesterase class II)
MVENNPDAGNSRSRDAYLAYHQILTSAYGAAVFKKMKEMFPEEVQALPRNFIGLLKFGLKYHDIAKTVENGWTNDLLHSERHPTEDEWKNVIIPHPEKSAELLENAGIVDKIILDIVRYHHVCFNGEHVTGFKPIEELVYGMTAALRVPRYGGYPGGIRGSDLGIGPRIAKPVDAASTMAERRPYQKNEKKIEDIIDEIRRGAATEYCPKVVAAFCAIPIERHREIITKKVLREEMEADLETRRAILRGEKGFGEFTLF